mmetsp:Transcript_5530/g.13379  ORF Transcript_5530/g.13379 Transcript_5530/m.13379 type:complete len:242 (-) Transcript_5530:1421-2146(-)
MRERRQAGRAALGQLVRGEAGIVMPGERLVEGMLAMPGLDPHLAGCFAGGIAAGAASGLHQQSEQSLRRPEIAAEQRPIRVDRGDEANAPEIMPLGDHLRADQDVHLALVHGLQLRLQFALATGGVGVDAQHARAGQGLGQLFLEPLGAAPERRDVRVAAVRAGLRHAFGEAAMVAAQRAVALVEDPPGAAVRAVALPLAFATVQHRCVAAAIQEDQALLAPLQAPPQLGQQRFAERAHHP